MLKTYKIVSDTSKGIWCVQYFLLPNAFTLFYPVYIPVFCILHQLKGTQHNTQKVLFIWSRGFLWFQTPPNIFKCSQGVFHISLQTITIYCIMSSEYYCCVFSLFTSHSLSAMPESVFYHHPWLPPSVNWDLEVYKEWLFFPDSFCLICFNYRNTKTSSHLTHILESLREVTVPDLMNGPLF